MKRLIAVLLALMVCMAMPLMAQEKGMEEKGMMDMPAPPPPLDHEFFKWMAGEWKGWDESAMGKAETWMNCKMEFGGQYLTMQYKSTSPMGEYEGGGAYTLNEEGGVVGIWIDSFRDMANGTGTIEGKVLTMNWEGKMGKGTMVTTKVDENKFTVTSKWQMPDGSMMEGKGEMTRVKEMTEKN